MSGEPRRIYLDYNATTPPAPQVREKLGEWLEQWGNPSSVHWAGRRPKAMLREARARVASFVGCQPLEILFTSGGTEANNLALRGVWEARRTEGTGQLRNELIISSVEHPAILRTAEALARQGVVVRMLGVDRGGGLSLDEFASLLSERTFLVSVMFANNETGIIYPIKKMAGMAHKAGALFHTDATQALGKSLISISDLGVDYATFAAHKFYGLRGAGALFVGSGRPLVAQVTGGGQERARRGGTENTLALAAFGEICSLDKAEVQNKILEVGELRDHFEKLILAKLLGVSINGLREHRLPNTSSLVISGVDGETLLMNLDLRGIAVSSGSACSSGASEPSGVLRAMGLSFGEARAALRVSLGWQTTRAEIELATDSITEVVTHLRETAGWRFEDSIPAASAQPGSRFGTDQ